MFIDERLDIILMTDAHKQLSLLLFQNAIKLFSLWFHKKNEQKKERNHKNLLATTLEYAALSAMQCVSSYTPH